MTAAPAGHIFHAVPDDAPNVTPRKESLEPIAGAARPGRRRLTWRGELTLALLPTATVLLVLAFVHALSDQRLLFASLASSAFLIYLDPQHGTNRVRTLVLSQMMAATIGLIVFLLLGPGYAAAASAMLATIVLMIVLDAVHPPAVSTALGFAFRAGSENNLFLFGIAVGMVAILVGLQRFSVWILVHSLSAMDHRDHSVPPRGRPQAPDARDR